MATSPPHRQPLDLAFESNEIAPRLDDRMWRLAREPKPRPH
jgi:hypothetical protein